MSRTATGKKRSGRKTKEEKLQEELQQRQEEERKQIITVIIIASFTLIGYMKWGFVGSILSNLQRFLFGRFYYVLMILIIIQFLIMIINRRSGNTESQNPFALVLILIGLLMIFTYIDTSHELKGLGILTSFTENLMDYFSADPPEKVGGGILGALLMSLSTYLVDWRGSVLIIVVLFIIAAVLLVNLEVYRQFFTTLKNFFAVSHEADTEDEEEADEEDEQTGNLLLEAPDEPAPDQGSTMKVINADPEKTEDLDVSALAMPAAEKPETSDSLVVIDLAKLPKNGPEETDSQHAQFMNVDDLVDHDESADEGTRTDEDLDKAYTEEEPASPAVEETPAPIEPVINQEEIPMGRHAAPIRPAMADQPVPETAPKHRPEKVYKLPKASLLDPLPPRVQDDVNAKAAAEKSELLLQALHNFDIEAKLVDTHIGPAVTKFEIRPDANIKVSRILGLADDIKMQLAVRDVRIEAPIPGRNAVGVEIPNQQSTPVKMRELINTIPEKERNQHLVIILGKDLLGNTVTCRLDKMPHLLIAGATGSGKSVCMNSIITSLLMRTKPDEVKLLLIDPKKVEFTPYQRVPHLIGPVINDPAQASNALKVIVKIMEDRYNAFSKAGVRNIQGFNEMVETAEAPADGSPKPQKMPFIVVIVDEMADLMAVAGKEVEGSIQRITQLARAAGIHLIVATQRPSTDVITGIIKANIPSRIAFAVSSGIDSRTILDHVGAERLLGNGDMLYLPLGASNATRVQGVFVTDDEVKRITDYVSSEAVPMYDDAFLLLEGINDGEGETGGVVSAADDPMLAEIKDYVIDAQKASTSLLQRRFGIGYNRAARMIDVLEQQGIIGPAQGSKPRDVYIKKNQK